MRRFIILGAFVLAAGHLVGQGNAALIGKWKLANYEAIDKIKNSPMYLLGSDEEVQKYDDMVKLLLDSTTYNFQVDGNLVYTDVENQKIIIRKARWIVSDSILSITELNRPYKREAKIISVTSSTLIIEPLIEGKGGDSKMIFNAESKK